MTTEKGSSSSLELLFSDITQQVTLHSQQLPPVHLWNPDKTGDMDLLIDREGRWIHEGREIKRQAMVKLFSRILVYEQGSFFLVTPVEKWQINVTVAPFFITQATRQTRNSEQIICLQTKTEDPVIVSSDYPIIMDSNIAQGETLPLVRVRDNLMGLISRSVYYQLIDWGYQVADSTGGNQLVIDSMGGSFSLGEF
ncbi:MAG: DUF1285 domain-containing protein [Porticoccaceae bacterium]